MYKNVYNWQLLLCLPMAAQASPELPADAEQRQKKKIID